LHIGDRETELGDRKTERKKGRDEEGLAEGKRTERKREGEGEGERQRK
jgi:hypothetical protein